MTPTNAKPSKPLSEARDADARHSMAALQRAAHKAKQLAASTNTPLIVVNCNTARSPATKPNQALTPKT